MAKTIRPCTALQTKHDELSKAVNAPAENRNLFCCCFIFKLANGNEIEIPLLKKFIPNNRQFPTTVIDLLTNNTQIDENANMIFSSCNPIYKAIGTINDLYNTFCDNIKNNPDSTPSDKNQAMILKTLGQRLDQGSSNAMRLTDSETKAIYVLQHKSVIDNIIDELCEIMNSDNSSQITSIEFHGCTTRDMCPLCFTNMNIIQYLYNNNSTRFSFLKYLKDTLITKKHPNTNTSYANSNLTTKMFISSTIIDTNNLNFSENIEEKQDNSLHQFRILP